MSALACEKTLPASANPAIFILGTRDAAIPLRREVETALDQHREVCIDFSRVTVTQSFMDEFLGVLILRRGPNIVQQLAFKECSEDTKAVIRFVASTRTHDYRALQTAAQSQ